MRIVFRSDTPLNDAGNRVDLLRAVAVDPPADDRRNAFNIICNIVFVQPVRHAEALQNGAENVFFQLSIALVALHAGGAAVRRPVDILVVPDKPQIRQKICLGHQQKGAFFLLAGVFEDLPCALGKIGHDRSLMVSSVSLTRSETVS